MSEQGVVVLVGILAGLLTAVPLIWLSWKIPQRVLGHSSIRHAFIGQVLVTTDPPIRTLQWQDLLMVKALCLCTVMIGLNWGAETQALAAFFYCSTLLLLARIDARTHLLPDVLTLPLLWAGLLWHTGGLGDLSVEQAVLGAAAGYIVLWLPCVVLRKCFDQDMMGHGDFKLSAAIGAWLGGASLPFVWLTASLSSLFIALFACYVFGRRLREPLPFGPGLALGGILMMFVDKWWSNF